VDEASAVKLAKRGGKTDGNPQELSKLDRSSEQPIQRLATRILEDERASALVSRELDWPDCPCRIQFGAQRVFVLESPEQFGRGMLGCRRQNQNRCSARCGQIPASAENEFAVGTKLVDDIFRNIHHSHFRIGSSHKPSAGAPQSASSIL
jgi:hypothetical protein